MTALRIGVLGAGAIGCYVGGCLVAENEDVVFVGRDRLKVELETSGLVLSKLDGGSGRVVPRDRIAFATDMKALSDRDIVLCCVKSAQTNEAGARLAQVVRKGTIVVSMQNGVRNADGLRQHLPAGDVLGGIVGFNVVSKGEGTFRRATSGPLVIENSFDPRLFALKQALTTAEFDVELVEDIRPLQWSKLIMNLNNAVSALSDRPTVDLIFKKGYRRVLAAVMEEALGVLRVAGQKTARLGPLPVRLFPMVLRLPDPLVRVIAGAQVKIDPEARSSMWEDLSRGRPTEVDDLNGEIVRLAERCGAAAPLNAKMVAMVHAAEKEAKGSPKMSAEALWSALNG
jgi:2-dehydropantoate 2-reductase